MEIKGRRVVFMNGLEMVIPDQPMCRYCGQYPQPVPGKQPYCRKCLNALRPKHSKLSKQQKHRANSRSYANVYVRRGKLKPQPCQACGSEKSQKHHEDYNKPLEVMWLCRPCHVELHKKKRLGTIICEPI